ncbi:MAG: hypothetical protein V4513_01440 [Pseudomonadota bacterium]
MSGAGLALPIVTLSEAQAFARIEIGEEEAVVAGLIRSASALAEAFLNQVVIARDFTLEIPASGEWERLALTPVRSIASVAALDADGVATALDSGSYAIDIDSSGDGWVRATNPLGGTRLEVTGSAGMALDENGVPEPIRQGVLRLVAHLFTARDGEGGEPPAAVTALWRPYRRMRLS